MSNTELSKSFIHIYSLSNKPLLRYTHFGEAIYNEETNLISYPKFKTDHQICETCNPIVKVSIFSKFLDLFRKRKSSDIFPSNAVSTSKYNILSFFPFNLYEQFKRKANIYFLVLSLLAFTKYSPKKPITIVFPLVFVLSITMIKEGWEDYKRYQEDKKENNKKYEKYNSVTNEWEEIASCQIHVGDIIMINKNLGEIPADILILQSSLPDGICCIETSNLDGETNFKLKNAIKGSCDIKCSSSGKNYPNLIEGYLESETPNPKLDKSGWKGTLFISSRDENIYSYPVNMSQLILRGSSLKNTNWIIGLVTFTGDETKIRQNNKESVFKRSMTEKKVDKFLYIIFVFQFLISVISTLFNFSFVRNTVNKTWYFDYIKTSIVDIVFHFLTVFTVVETMVPISLYVSIEFVKFGQSLYINYDKSLYLKEKNIGAKARTSNLNEDLGQVGIIFSDKTGTITQNKMEFMYGSVGGVIYGPDEMEIQNDYMPELKIPINANLPIVDEGFKFNDNRLLQRSEYRGEYNIHDEFLTLLSTCHTVIPELIKNKDNENPIIKYNSESPDEKALVIFAKNLRYHCFERKASTLVINNQRIQTQTLMVNIKGEICHFEIYEILEFDSYRKRMSVLLKDSRDKKIKLYTKGADNVLKDLISKESKEKLWEVTINHINTFSEKGLRILVCAYKEINEKEFEKWILNHHKCKKDLNRKEKLINQNFDLLERNLNLIGATAVEDKLQKDVPETIASFEEAKVRIWVLTGDKTQTAVNIGKSCNLITRKMEIYPNLFVLDIDEKLNPIDAYTITKNTLEKAWKIFENKPDNCEYLGFVISGTSFNIIIPPNDRENKNSKIKIKKKSYLKDILINLLLKCRVVICCRLSPQQKSLIVKLVKKRLKNIVTLAIGDGANDVPMIKSAHIGVGIVGKEGTQAAMSSDYSITSFSHLATLMFIHGGWSYIRLSKLIYYSFYKNICSCSLMTLYLIFSGWSGNLFLPSSALTFYNLMYTALPVMLMAILDRPYSKRHAIEYHQLYTDGINNKYLNYYLFIIWVITGLMHAIVIFTMFFYVFDENFMVNNRGNLNHCNITISAFTTLLIVMTSKVLVETESITIVTIVGTIITTVPWWFVMVYVFGILPKEWIGDIQGCPAKTFDIFQIWIMLVTIPIACLLPELIIKAFRRHLQPTMVDILQEIERYDEGSKKYEVDEKKPSDQLKEPEIKENLVKTRGYSMYDQKKDKGPEWIDFMHSSIKKNIGINEEKNEKLLKK